MGDQVDDHVKPDFSGFRYIMVGTFPFDSLMPCCSRFPACEYIMVGPFADSSDTERNLGSGTPNTAPYQVKER